MIISTFEQLNDAIAEHVMGWKPQRECWYPSTDWNHAIRAAEAAFDNPGVAIASSILAYKKMEPGEPLHGMLPLFCGTMLKQVGVEFKFDSDFEDKANAN